jgi:hypothetical protein
VVVVVVVVVVVGGGGGSFVSALREASVAYACLIIVHTYSLSTSERVCHPCTCVMSSSVVSPLQVCHPCTYTCRRPLVWYRLCECAILVSTRVAVLESSMTLRTCERPRVWHRLWLVVFFARSAMDGDGRGPHASVRARRSPANRIPQVLSVHWWLRPNGSCCHAGTVLPKSVNKHESRVHVYVHM